jgi:hypothetical protein
LENQGVDDRIVQVKIKGAPVIFLTQHHAMKTYWGSGGIDPRILDLGTIKR